MHRSTWRRKKTIKSEKDAYHCNITICIESGDEYDGREREREDEMHTEALVMQRER